MKPHHCNFQQLVGRLLASKGPVSLIDSWPISLQMLHVQPSLRALMRDYRIGQALSILPNEHGARTLTCSYAPSDANLISPPRLRPSRNTTSAATASETCFRRVSSCSIHGRRLPNETWTTHDLPHPVLHTLYGKCPRVEGEHLYEASISGFEV